MRFTSKFTASVGPLLTPPVAKWLFAVKRETSSLTATGASLPG
jgi:hypothetical protein